MKIQLFCKCGAGAEGDVPTLQAAEKFRAVWYAEHEGPEHGDCGQPEALEAFRRKHGYDPR